MNILIISGSHRANSNSLRVATRYLEALESMDGITGDLIDLHDESISLWSEDFWAASSDEKSQWEPISARLKLADGFVVIAPEYGGMVPPALMNFLLKCSGPETGHKPALLVGVSSGAGGCYPLVQLRQFGFKNNFLCMIPFNILIKQASGLFCNDAAVSDYEQSVERKIIYSVPLLLEYARALNLVRSGRVVDYDAHPYGM